MRTYPDDLEEELETEIVHFASVIKGFLAEDVMEISHTFEIDMYIQIIENELEEAFPNVAIMFKV